MMIIINIVTNQRKRLSYFGVENIGGEKRGTTTTGTIGEANIIINIVVRASIHRERKKYQKEECERA
jgi:hypothetical protein